MQYCRACGISGNDDDATFCKRCGKAELAPAGTMEGATGAAGTPPPAAAETPPKPSSPGCVGWAIVVLAIIVIGSCISAMGGGDQASDDKIGAIVVCKDFVTDRLRAPSTAGFPLANTSDVTTNTDGTFTYRSHVDSQNGFGAMIRTRFECKVRPTGGDNWRLVDLDLSE